MFYVVATPIGNLKDITLRALEVLRAVDVIAAEDTRVTKKLLSHFDISKPLISYREHVHVHTAKRILGLLKERKSVALVSDAGTPAISDPGSRLVRDVLNAGFHVASLPGPSALIAALSISGINADEFLFLGYPPHKKRRAAFFQEVKDSKHTVVIYESPHRLLKTLKEIKARIGPGREITAIKELTKMFERIYRGRIDQVTKEIENDKIRGEWVIVLSTSARD